MLLFRRFLLWLNYFRYLRFVLHWVKVWWKLSIFECRIFWSPFWLFCDVKLIFFLGFFSGKEFFLNFFDLLFDFLEVSQLLAGTQNLLVRNVYFSKLVFAARFELIRIRIHQFYLECILLFITIFWFFGWFFHF